MNRKDRLMPAGIPRYVRCYDNGGETFDRYTVVYTGRFPGRAIGWTYFRGMSAHPYHPQGFGQWGESRTADFWPGGKRIPLEALPTDCQCAAIADYRDLWGIPA